MASLDPYLRYFLWTWIQKKITQRKVDPFGKDGTLTEKKSAKVSFRKLYFMTTWITVDIFEQPRLSNLRDEDLYLFTQQ